MKVMEVETGAGLVLTAMARRYSGKTGLPRTIKIAAKKWNA
jgi:hypothetical protein